MRIAYWSNACLEPRYEAVSKEVLSLAGEFSGSWVFSLSDHLRAKASLRRKYLGLHSAFGCVFRLGIPLLERAFDVNHIYGDMTPWVYHKALRSRPIVHTVTQDCDQPVLELLSRCKALVTQTDATHERLLSLGVPRAKLHLRYPGVDLARFQPTTPPARPFVTPRVLFATSPRTIEEMEGRGVYLLLDAAKRCPEVTFRLLYRTWNVGYTSLEPTRLAINERDLTNVNLADSVVSNMSAEYQQAQLTVIPFTRRSGGKECPNSALESLASGVPVIVSCKCPFARFVADNDCGIVFDPTPDALVAAIEEALGRWPTLSAAARTAAELHFDSHRLVELYKELYDAAVNGRRISSQRLSPTGS